MIILTYIGKVLHVQRVDAAYGKAHVSVGHSFHDDESALKAEWTV